MISDAVELDAAEAISSAKAYADALTGAAEKLTALQEKSAAFGASGAGPDRLVAAWDKAAGSISASIDKISQSGAKLADLGTARGGAGPGRLAASWDKAAASISGSIDKIAASGARLDRLGTGADAAAGPVGKLGAALDETAAGAGKLAGASGPARDGVKGIGDSAKMSAADLAEFNAVLAESARFQREAAAASADASAKIATSQRLQTASAKKLSDDAMAAQRAQRDAAAEGAAAAEASQKRYRNLLLGGAAIAGYGIYKAGQLQAGTTKLATTAGESPGYLPMIMHAIPRLAGQTATSQSELLQGLYMIESAGIHGPGALGVLKAAAQGAYAEGAPLSETSNALTSLMNAYGMKPGQATSAMDQIIAMVSSGKMTMAGAVSSLPAVLPAGAAAGLPFAQVGGALATMTGMGMSPEHAAQNLAHTIGALQNPSHVQTLEMQQLGINSVSLSKNLGKEGLTGAITQVEGAILRNMGPAGTVLLKSFNASKLAAQSARQEIAAMPAPLARTAQAYLDGSISTKQWRQELQALPPLQSNLLKQFGSTADAAHGFNNQLRSGGSNAQTFSAALSKAMGGTVGMNTALMLGGAHAGTFSRNVDTVDAAAKRAGQNIEGWDAIQKNFNFQLGSFKQSAEAAATTVGVALLPAATGVMHALSGVGGFLSDHPGLTKGLTLGAGGLGLLGVLPKLARPVVTGAQMVGKVAEVLKIPGLDRLAGLGQGGAAAGMQRAGDTMVTAAGAMQRAADTIAGAGELGGGLPGGKGKALGAAAREGAAAEEAAGGAGAMGLVKGIPGALGAAAGPIGQGVLIGAIIKSVGDALAPRGSFAGKLNYQLQQTQGVNTGPLHPYVFGGLEAKAATSGVGMAIGNFINRGLSAASQMFTVPLHTLTHPGGPVAPYLPSSPAFRVAGPGGAAVPPPKPVKIPPPDLSALDAAKGKAQNALAQIGQFHPKPIKLPAPDLGQLDAARAKAQNAGAQIQRGVETPLKRPAKMAAPDLSAASAAAGKAAAIGASISQGLAAGIRSGIPAIQAAAGAAAAAASAAMAITAKVRSPSEVTHKIGAEMGEGLAQGIHSKTAKVKAAAKQLTESAAQSLKTGLLGGQSAVDAVSTALGKGPRPEDIASIDQSTAKLISQVPKGHSTLVAMLRADNQELDALARKRAILEQEITNAQQVTTSAIGSASIMNALTAQPASSQEPLSSAGLVQGMGVQAGNLKQFASQVKALQKKHLNATSLDQIIQAGADQGGQIAQALLSDPGSIKQVNQLEKSILKSSGAIGDVGGKAMFQAGQDAGAAAAKGLKSQLGQIESIMNQIAAKMVSALQSVLGHDTSKKKPGTHPGTGGGAGGGSVPTSVGGGGSSLHVPSFDKLAAMSNSAANALARDVTAANSFASALNRAASAVSHPAGRHGGGGHPGGGGGGTPPVVIHNHYVTNVTVQGTVTAEHDLYDRLQDIHLQKADRNWQGGWQHPGRAV